ncbi:amphipathic helix protein Sin3-like [Seminavis robusta]|uniref:Amphipathic helix protein Sin3-like n=1 Tax=Seminavis robusta TaxID=568900 RepID=A0A9N8HJM9_9STRA|nr:amphipathic helix protein Sin3-like [Seminavis robusta]|eukprot:Sro673_g185170.1 amphipathic helix protein Sin3-like (909) ;mRNA; f:10293-13019
MMRDRSPPTIVVDENLFTGGVTHVSPRRSGRPPTYNRRSPSRTPVRANSNRDPPITINTSRVTPKTISNSSPFAFTPPKSAYTSQSPYTSPPKQPSPAAALSSSSTLRNITAEAENVVVYRHQQQQRHLSSAASQSPSILSQGSNGEGAGYLPVGSARRDSYASDEKLVTRLYGQIETQEGEFNRLTAEYREALRNQKEEVKQRERLEKELEEAREELEMSKKRYTNFKKQERDLMRKSELDQKERMREEGSRWDYTMEELVTLRRDLSAKNQKLVEFEFMCLNLQQTLDNERSKKQVELVDAEKRIARSSETLQTAHAQVSRADKQLKKEKKMKQILIKINEALQKEVKRVQEELQKANKTIREQKEQQKEQQHQQHQQQQQHQAELASAPSMHQSKSGESSFVRQNHSNEIFTSQIMQDLQIEDALFYFEEVKKEYEDRPKVYRVFLEIIRDYKSRNLSTPEVIAKISKLFQGNSKLIIGFNRFLPNDYHITEEDVSDMESYNGDHVHERYQVPSVASKEPKKSKEDEEQSQSSNESEVQGVIVVGSRVDGPAADQAKAQQNVVVGTVWQKPKDKVAGWVGGKNMGKKVEQTKTVDSQNTTVAAATKGRSKGEGKSVVARSNTNVSGPPKGRSRGEDKSAVARSNATDAPAPKGKSRGEDKSVARSTKSGKSGKNSKNSKGDKNGLKATANATRAKEEHNKSPPKRHPSGLGPSLVDSSSGSSESIEVSASVVSGSKPNASSNNNVLLTISTSSSLDENAARPPVKKLPADFQDEDEDADDEGGDTTTVLNSETDNASSTTPVSAAGADVASPRMDLGVLSSVTSSHVFGGIESVGDSFGVGILSVDQSTLFMPSDRYDVVEDCEYNAIELVADPHGGSRGKSEGGSSSKLVASSLSSLDFYGWNV